MFMSRQARSWAGYLLPGVLAVSLLAGCSSISGVEFRLNGAATEDRNLLMEVAQQFGFEAVDFCLSSSTEYCAQRASSHPSWPLMLYARQEAGGFKVFVGRRNILLSNDERDVLVSLIRKLQERGAPVTVERALGVRLPKDLQASKDRDAV